MTDINTLYTHLETLNKQWFYDKTEVDTKIQEVDSRFSEYTERSSYDTEIGNLWDSYMNLYVEVSEKQTPNSGALKSYSIIQGETEKGTIDIPNTLVQKSATVGLIKNDGTIDTNTYLTQHQDISGKANTADLHAVATSGSYLDLENIPSTFAPSTHTHLVSDITDFTASASDIVDSNAHTNIGTSANANQSAINTAIDIKIGSLLAVELIEVASTLPTASANTKNRLYFVPESDAETNDAYEIYVTVEDTGSYAWERIDTTRIDLSGYASASHAHGNLTNDGKIGSVTGKVVVTTTGGVLTTSDWVTEVDNVIQQLTTYGNNLSGNSGGIK